MTYHKPMTGSFPLCHVLLEQVNWWIVRTSEQAETGNGRSEQLQQHQGHRSLQRSSRPSWPDCWPKFFVMAGAVQGRWSDHASIILLENLRPKESLWNLKVEAYGNKSKKKSDIEELLEEVADVAPQGVDTKALKGNNHQNRQLLLVQKLP